MLYHNMVQDIQQEFKNICDRLRRSDPRLTILDKSFYFRFCSLLCERPDAEVVTILTEALAKNVLLEELTLDGAILYRHANAELHSQLVHKHLLRNCHNLKRLHMRWCEIDENLLNVVGQNTSLKSVEMHVSKCVDLETLLASSSSIESLTVQSLGKVQGVGKGILKNCSLRRLHLAARLEDEEVESLFTSLEANKSSSGLTHLQIKIKSPEQAVYLSRFLQSPMCQLQELDLTNSNLRDAASQVAILEGLARNTSLRHLSLHQTYLGKTGLDRSSWCHAFAANRTLRSLNLSCNFLKPTDIQILMEALPQSPALQELDFQLNVFASQSSVILAEALTRTRWTKLSVTGMEFESADDAIILQRSLMQNKYLKRLDLGYLWIIHQQHEGWTAILEGLVANETLEAITVHAYGEKPEHIRDFLLAMRQKKNLKYLALRNSQFCPAVCDEALTELLKSETLEELDLGKNTGICKSTAKALAKGLLTNRTLKILRLYQCQDATGQDWEDVVSALEVNDTLSVLDLQCISAQRVDGHAVFGQLLQSLPKMKGLKKFLFHGPCGYAPDDTASAQFLQALECNYQLEHVTLTFHGKYQERMDYLLELNRSGRRFLRSNAMSMSHLPEVLSKMAAKKDLSVLHYTLGRSVELWSQGGHQVRCHTKRSNFVHVKAESTVTTMTLLPSLMSTRISTAKSA